MPKTWQPACLADGQHMQRRRGLGSGAYKPPPVQGQGHEAEWALGQGRVSLTDVISLL